jgi:hypothetical protein
MAGYVAQKGGVKIFDPEKKTDFGLPHATKKGLVIGYAGLGAGAYAGGKLGAKIGKTAAAAYYARKYGVSLSIAELMLSLGFGLAGSEKKIFIAAENRNNNLLKRFLSGFYQDMLGSNWKNTLEQMLEIDELNFYFNYQFNKDKEIAAQAKRFYEAAEITWALGMLYFGNNIYLASSGYDNIIATTKKLLKALDILN